MDYFLQLRKTGGVFVASKCQYGPHNPYLLVSPDFHSAQIISDITGMESSPELGKILFWKSLIQFDNKLPLIRSVSLSCCLCNRPYPAQSYTASQICLACKVPTKTFCKTCKRPITEDMVFGERCLMCSTVSSFLIRYHISPAFEEIPVLFGGED